MSEEIGPPEQPGLLKKLVAAGAVTPPVDSKRTPLRRRIKPTAPVSPLIIEDRR